MSAKGFVTPNAQYWIRAQETNFIYLTWKTGDGWNTSQSKSFHHDNALTGIELAHNWLWAAPSIAEQQKSEFVNKMAELIDEGRKIGIDVEFINPLTEAMRKLSENALTFTPPPATHDANGDDIPF